MIENTAMAGIKASADDFYMGKVGNRNTRLVRNSLIEKFGNAELLRGEVDGILLFQFPTINSCIILGR